MMELEPLARRASSPLVVLVAASASVPLVDGSLHRGRDLARRGGGFALRERLPRRPGPGEAPGFEPLELLGDGLLDDGGQVAVGHRGAHEGLQALELVTEPGGGGELDPVAAGGQRRTPGGPCRAGGRSRATEAPSSGRSPRENNSASRPSRRAGDAEVGLGLGEVEGLGAVGEHRGRGFAGVEPAPVDLAEVSDEVGLVATGLTEQIRQATEEIVVGERRQRVSAFRADNIGRRFATSQGRLWRAPWTLAQEDRRGGDARGRSARRTRDFSSRSATARGGALETCQGEREEKGRLFGGICGLKLVPWAEGKNHLALPDVDTRSAEEILGYDERGAFR